MTDPKMVLVPQAELEWLRDCGDFEMGDGDEARRRCKVWLAARPQVDAAPAAPWEAKYAAEVLAMFTAFGVVADDAVQRRLSHAALKWLADKRDGHVPSVLRAPAAPDLVGLLREARLTVNALLPFTKEDYVSLDAALDLISRIDTALRGVQDDNKIRGTSSGSLTDSDSHRAEVANLVPVCWQYRYTDPMGIRGSGWNHCDEYDVKKIQDNKGKPDWNGYEIRQLFAKEEPK